MTAAAKPKSAAVLLESRYVLAEEAAAEGEKGELATLKRRVAQLEKKFSDLPDAFGAALAAFVGNEGFMKYAGTFDADNEGYSKGSVVAHDGASWVAITQTVKGAKPGRAPEWRMTAKGDGGR
jgi:hypothetical protein